MLRNFRSQTNVILRDGQSVQYVAATDPVSGELLKIDVTLNDETVSFDAVDVTSRLQLTDGDLVWPRRLTT